MDNPCYKCPHRNAGCHDACPAYAKFKDDNEARKQRIRREWAKDDYAKRLWK